MGLRSAGAAAKDTEASPTPPGLLDKIVTGSDGGLCRGLFPSGAVWLTERDGCRWDWHRKNCGGPCGAQTHPGYVQ